MEKKALILGATGAMGVYLVPELLKMGYRVDGVSLDASVSKDPRLTYIQANAKDLDFLTQQLQNSYDAVVDFMIYPEPEKFAPYRDLFLENAKHYIYLSSYRVYAGTAPITEESPRLADIDLPEEFEKHREYSIYKAAGEDMLRASGRNNWTIIRPAITYSKQRFQLTILEASTVIRRAKLGKTLVLPESAMDKQATMSWAGDVAKMIARLILNPDAYAEVFSVCTAEHNTWREVAEMYKEITGLNYITVDNETFLEILNPGNIYTRQQLLYDRCFDRIMDNRKILKVTGLKQSDLMLLKEGIAREFAQVNVDKLPLAAEANARMDAYLESRK